MSGKKKAPKKFNPIAHDLCATPKYRKRVVPNDETKARKQDQWSRDAKHKKTPLQEAEEKYLAQPDSLTEFYQVGDKVEVVKGPLRAVLDKANKLAAQKKAEKGVEPGDKVEKKPEDEHAIVRDPHGPADTIGITIDGEYHLVDEEDVELMLEAFASAGAELLEESEDEEEDFDELCEWSYAETTSGIRVPISSEENEILNKCGSPLYKNNLDDREQEVARRMVSRGVLHRRKDDGGIYFVRDNQKLTRF